MHLYYLFAESSGWSALDESLLPYVSEERRLKIQSYRLTKDKKLSLYAGLLLPYACADQYDLSFEEVDPVWTEKKKPVLKTHPEIRFSISHSGTCAAVAVSDEEIGLDAELIARAPMVTLKRAFSPREARQIQCAADPNLEFYRIWTRKEAYGKYLGTGLSNHVLKTDTFLPEHDGRISSGILTDPASSGSASLYYSVYGKSSPLEVIPVTWNALIEFFLLYV